MNAVLNMESHRQLTSKQDACKNPISKKYSLNLLLCRCTVN